MKGEWVDQDLKQRLEEISSNTSMLPTEKLFARFAVFGEQYLRDVEREPHNAGIIDSQHCGLAGVAISLAKAHRAVVADMNLEAPMACKGGKRGKGGKRRK